jgi:hypothetical protein
MMTEEARLVVGNPSAAFTVEDVRHAIAGATGLNGLLGRAPWRGHSEQGLVADR